FARAKGGIWIDLLDKAPKRVRGLEVHIEIAGCQAEPGFFRGGGGLGAAAVAVPLRPEARGILRSMCVELRTSYPFGFLEKAWRFQVEAPLVVSPNPAGAAAPQGGSGEFADPSPKSGHSGPVGARPFVPGDSINQIHWKRTAQRGEPWIRIMEGDQPKGVVLEIDLGEWEPGPEFEGELERLSGTILHARLNRTEASLKIFGRDGRREAVGHTEAWKALATLEGEKASSCP
ncbi:MAG: DUF58 domain-containing protein, partial [Holophagaceae bacterium]|nr:DUF58 domain-containing protein [Holophagaceae bacterium]